MFSQRFPRGYPRKMNDPLPPWLLIIHAANRIEKKIFGEPDFVGEREGVGYVEEYLDATVIFPADDPLTVKIIATTELGDRVLKQAVAARELSDDAFLRKVQKRQEAEAAQDHVDRIAAKHGDA